jgi:hypothetical protein
MAGPVRPRAVQFDFELGADRNSSRLPGSGQIRTFFGIQPDFENWTQAGARPLRSLPLAFVAYFAPLQQHPLRCRNARSQLSEERSILRRVLRDPIWISLPNGPICFFARACFDFDADQNRNTEWGYSVISASTDE